MIIKLKEDSHINTPDCNQYLAEDKSENDHAQFDIHMFDEKSASNILSIFRCPDSENIEAMDETADGASEACSNTASIKFMITSQDENNLLNLGYSQTQINKLKPQEVADILKNAEKCGRKDY